MKVLCSQAFASPHLWELSHRRSLRWRLHLRHHGVCPGSWLPKDSRRRWSGPKLLIFMYFHGVFLGRPHEMWSKQHNGKVSMITLQRHMNIDRGTFSWYLFPSTQNSTRRQRMLPAYRTADEPFTIPQFALTRSDIDSFMEELRGFHTAFRDCFTRQEPRDQ